MKQTTVLLITVLMLTGLGSAQEITVSPSNFHEDIVAGDTVEKEVDVAWSGDASTVVEMKAEYSTENKSVEEGFYTAFEPQEFILDSGDTKTVDVSMETSTGLVPDKYFISFKAETETELKSEVIRDTTIIDRTEEISQQHQEELEELGDRLNQTEDELSDARSESESQEEVIQNLNKTINELENEKQQILQDKQDLSNRLDNIDSQESSLEDKQSKVQNLEEQLNSRSNLVKLLIITLLFLVLGMAYIYFYRREDLIDHLQDCEPE